MKWFVILLLLGCNTWNGTIAVAQQECAGIPKFITKFGFNPQSTALSTDEKNIIGFAIKDTKNPRRPPFQHETWDDAGTMANIVRDPEGNCFSYPVPSVNTLTNPPLKQNILYRIDSNTGIMESFMELPAGAKKTAENPFGILGSTYDCHNNYLYVASVYHSDRKNERGVIYCIDVKQKKIVDKLENIDAIGLLVMTGGGLKKLLFGKARSSEVWSVDLTMDGKFAGNLASEFTLDNLGPRGDDRVRKIKFDPQTKDLLIFGTEFYYTLIAPSKDQASIYRFRLNTTNGQWQFAGIEP